MLKINHENSNKFAAYNLALSFQQNINIS